MPPEKPTNSPSSIKGLIADVREIKEALLGNEYNPNGYIKRLEKVECSQQQFNNYKQRIIGAVIAIQIVGAAVMAVIGIYIKTKP